MRIDAFNKISQLYKANNVKSASKTRNGSFSDKLEISQTGKDYQAAKQIVNSIPDVREERVSEIKQCMESGVYNITMEEVADKLVDNYFDEIT